MPLPDFPRPEVERHAGRRALGVRETGRFLLLAPRHPGLERDRPLRLNVMGTALDRLPQAGPRGLRARPPRRPQED